MGKHLLSKHEDLNFESQNAAVMADPERSLADQCSQIASFIFCENNLSQSNEVEMIEEGI